jgi:hypothetical protein
MLLLPRGKGTQMQLYIVAERLGKFIIALGHLDAKEDMQPVIPS